MKNRHLNRFSFYKILFGMGITLSVATAQKTTDISGTLILPGIPFNESVTRISAGSGMISGIGSTAMRVELAQAPSQQGPVGAGKAVVTMATNRRDSFQVSFDFENPAIPGQAFLAFRGTGQISGGTGAYQGATGTATFQISQGSNIRWFAGGSGSVKVGSQTTSFTITSLPLDVVDNKYEGIENGTFPLTLAPLGNVKLLIFSTGNQNGFKQYTMTVQISETDSFKAFLTVTNDTIPPNWPGAIFGGTGAYSGAFGTVTLNVSQSANGFLLGIVGKITQPAASAPVIGSVVTAGSEGASQNAWMEITGKNLTPASTPAGGTFWSSAPEFAAGKMPTKIGDVSVTVNGKPAYIWWFCSAVTTSGCARDQINVLAPSTDNYVGQVQVVVKNGDVLSAPFYVNKKNLSTSFLLFNDKGYVVATHANGTLLGPTSLYPGSSTPATPGETIILWGVGWGSVGSPTLVEGSSTQSSLLRPIQSCLLSGLPTTAVGAVVSPGLYQINLTVPATATPGDHVISCVYQDAYTPIGNLISVQ